MLFTKPERTRLHLHYFNPSFHNLFKWLEHAYSEKATNDVKRIIEELTTACSACKAFCTRPYRFRVSFLPEQVIFNEELAIDLLWLENKPVLYVVRIHIHYRNVIWTKSKTAMEYGWHSWNVGAPYTSATQTKSGAIGNLL